MCRTSPGARRRLAFNRELVAVAESMVPTDVLAGEARGRSPHATAGAVAADVVMDRVRRIGDGHRRLQRDWMRGDLGAVAKMNSDEPGESPDPLTKHRERIVVEYRDRHDLEVERGGGECAERARRRIISFGRRDQRGALDAGSLHFRSNHIQCRKRRAERVTEHDPVGPAEHTEQRSSSAAVLIGAFEQPWDLDELDENTA